MNRQSYSNTPGYTILLIGVALAFYSALVPHFEAGYRLDILVFLTGMLPYMVYGIAVPLMRSAKVTLTGVAIIVVHAWLIFEHRITGGGDYSDGVIYFVPMALTVLAVPVAILALRHSRHYP
mgnify:CR=1 FL=1